MRHIIAVTLENEAGALSRVSGLFSARGFNIESLTVAATNDKTLSRMIIVSIGSEKVIEQIVKQLDKLIDVVSVIDLTSSSHIERELLLVKTTVDVKNQADLDRIIDDFSAKIVDVSDDAYTIELATKSTKINTFLEQLNTLKSTAILEVSRTGVTGIRTGLKP